MWLSTLWSPEGLISPKESSASRRGRPRATNSGVQEVPPLMPISPGGTTPALRMPQGCSAAPVIIPLEMLELTRLVHRALKR